MLLYTPILRFQSQSKTSKLFAIKRMASFVIAFILLISPNGMGLDSQLLGSQRQQTQGLPSNSQTKQDLGLGTIAHTYNPST